MNHRTLHIVASVLLGCACSSTTSSQQIRTAALVALIDITAERSDQAVVSADVVVGGVRSNTHVVLEGGDRLLATRGGEWYEMRSLGNGSYEARFERTEGEFVVSLLRNAQAHAPRNVGTLPASFDIMNEFTEHAISRANDALLLTWSPVDHDNALTIELEGDCIHSVEFQLDADTGSYAIEPGKLTAWKSQEKETCGVALRIVRTRKGQPDPGLDADSSVVLRQIRSTRFVSGP